MATEKRLIDANWILGEIEHDLGCYEIENIMQEDGLYVELRDVVRMVCAAPTVDAVDAEMYNDLMDAFIDHVCSGIPNVAPFCCNRCRECVDGRGWCKEDPATCRGFNPDVRKMDGEGNG